MNSDENKFDDLTIISGIGPVRQEWLREAFGVKKYHDLAALLADQIETSLKAEGKIASRSAIETWIRQANELASRASFLQSEIETVNNEISKEANSLGNKEDWKPFASFVVEFQTREVQGRAEEHRTAVHHMEEDKGKDWSGIEGKQLCQWMLDQINAERATVEAKVDLTEAQFEEKPRIENGDARIRIKDIRFFQPPQSDVYKNVENNGPSSLTVKGNQPMRINVDFDLTGSVAENITRSQVGYNLKVFAYDQNKEESILLKEIESNTFEEGVLNYSIMIPEVSLHPGEYRFWVTVSSEGGRVIPDYLEVSEFVAE